MAFALSACASSGGSSNESSSFINASSGDVSSSSSKANVVSIAVVPNSVKTEFTVGDVFSVGGGRLIVTYDDQTSAEVWIELGMIQNPPDMNVPVDDYVVNVFFQGQTTSYHISIKTATVYALNKTSLTLEVGEKYQLKVLQDGAPYQGSIQWAISTDLIDIDQNGVVQGIYPTSSDIDCRVQALSNDFNLFCYVTVVGRSSNIYRCMTANSSAKPTVEDGNHVVYTVTKEESFNGATKYRNMYSFAYDSLTEKCKIEFARANYWVNSEGYQWVEVIAGANEFDWGDYENGGFYGIYGQMIYDQSPARSYQANIVFDNDYLVFDGEEYVMKLRNDPNYYEVVKDEFEEGGLAPVTSDEVRSVLGAVVTCKTFADQDVFYSYNQSHPDDPIRLF